MAHAFNFPVGNQTAAGGRYPAGANLASHHSRSRIPAGPTPSGSMA